jgi:hypothetical protein
LFFVSLIVVLLGKIAHCTTGNNAARREQREALHGCRAQCRGVISMV